MGTESSSLEEPPQTEGAAASQGTLAEAEGKGTAPPQLVRAIRQSLDSATRVLASLHHHQRSKRHTGLQPRREGGQRHATQRVGRTRPKGVSGTRRRTAERRSSETDPSREILLFAGRAQPVQEMTVSTSEVEASDVKRNPPAKTLGRGCRTRKGVEDRPSNSSFVYTQHIKKSKREAGELVSPHQVGTS